MIAADPKINTSVRSSSESVSESNWINLAILSGISDIRYRYQTKGHAAIIDSPQAALS
jgi:hypothetical protein